MWMDHHCYFAGQCVGFYNLRCFIVWLSYTLCLLQLLMISVVRRLLATTDDPRLHSKLGAYIVFLMAFWFFVANMLVDTLNRLFAGWPSKVLWAKFKGIRTSVQNA